MRFKHKNFEIIVETFDSGEKLGMALKQEGRDLITWYDLTDEIRKAIYEHQMTVIGKDASDV